MPSIDSFIARFTPNELLAKQIFSALPDHDDGAHDIAHLFRVWKLAKNIQAIEGGDVEVVLAATLLHDAILVEKSSEERKNASSVAARFATNLLRRLSWSEQKIEKVAHAIEAHSYSAGVLPTSIEAKILQDADRLDALGAVGVARCFYTAGRMRSVLYDAFDPGASFRQLDDKRFALDHFKLKLIPVADKMQTNTGQELARKRVSILQSFMLDLLDEVSN